MLNLFQRPTERIEMSKSETVVQTPSLDGGNQQGADSATVGIIRQLPSRQQSDTKHERAQFDNKYRQGALHLLMQLLQNTAPSFANARKYKFSNHVEMMDKIHSFNQSWFHRVGNRRVLQIDVRNHGIGVTGPEWLATGSRLVPISASAFFDVLIDNDASSSLRQIERIACDVMHTSIALGQGRTLFYRCGKSAVMMVMIDEENNVTVTIKRDIHRRSTLSRLYEKTRMFLKWPRNDRFSSEEIWDQSKIAEQQMFQE